ncbi:MAG: phosphate acetyltransferase [Desulfovibrionaceae bacterium]
MSKSLYITTTETVSGKSAISLGVMQLLLRDVQNVAFFRPVMTIDPMDGLDYYTRLIRTYFKLDIPYEDTYAYTMNEAREMILAGRNEEFLDTILAKYKALEAQYDFVLCLGTDFLSKETSFEFDINADIASNLGTPVMIVVNAAKKTHDQVISSVQHAVESYCERSVDVISVIVNRVSEDAAAMVTADVLECIKGTAEPLVYAIPEEPMLGKPTMEDVRKWLDAKVLYGAEGMKTQVDNLVIAAMEMQNFLEYVERGSLIITPGDRADIMLSSINCRMGDTLPHPAGILLTGGIKPHPQVDRLIRGFKEMPLSVLITRGNTYKTIHTLHDLYGRIEPDDEVKTSSALGAFEAHVDQDELRQRLITTATNRVTPRMFEYGLISKAQSNLQRIVLPEGEEERILRATVILLRRGVAHIILLGNPDDLHARAARLGLDISGAEIVNPKTDPKLETYANAYYELRKKKGVTPELARDTMDDRAFFGTMMVHLGDADGMVSGSITTTAATIRPAFQIIKTKPGASIVSSVFFMCLKDRVLVFGDCAVNPDPTAEQLAEIALSAAETARIFGVAPKVAMLSYSTGDSGKGAQVEKVIEATRIARERDPYEAIEGPIQYDAAIDPDVARTKMPDSRVAGQATVFVFPDLNTGNNTYKAVQRAAQAVAIGPVLQGLNKPVNDLSRGCTVPDIVNTVAITAIQAQAIKE